LRKRKLLKVYTVHGWSYSPEVWKDTPFRNAFHFTLPGHGKNRDFKEGNLFLFAEWVGSKIERESILVGWSLGATVCVLSALMYPEKVEKLVLIAPTPKFSSLSQEEVVVKRFLRNLKRNFKKTVSEFRKLASKKKFPIPELEENVAFKLLEDFCFLDIRKELEKLSCQVTVFGGLKDEITKIEGALETFNRIKFGRLKVFDEDHFTILQKVHFC